MLHWAKWIQSSLESRKDGASTSYKHFQGDCLFPRIGFSQRLLTSCVISCGVVDPGPYLNLTLVVTEASTHIVSTSSLLPALQSPLLLVWLLPVFFKDPSHEKPRRWIFEWTFPVLNLVVSCHRSTDSLNSDFSAVWIFFSGYIKHPHSLRLQHLILHAKNLQFLWTVYFQQIIACLLFPSLRKIKWKVRVGGGGRHFSPCSPHR